MTSLINWLLTIGSLLIGSAIAFWGLTEVNKVIAIWAIGVPGALMLVLAGAIELTKFAREIEFSKPAIVAVPDRPTAGDSEVQRPWLGVDVELAGSLTIKNGIAIPLRITMTNSSMVPAVGALPVPMIFTNEKQPFSVEEIIKRRSASFGTGGGLGHSVFQNKFISEINTPSNVADEYRGQETIAPFILVPIKYKSPGAEKVYLTANLYMLARKNPAGGIVAIKVEDRQIPASELILTQLGSYAE